MESKKEFSTAHSRLSAKVKIGSVVSHGPEKAIALKCKLALVCDALENLGKGVFALSEMERVTEP